MVEIKNAAAKPAAKLAKLPSIQPEELTPPTKQISKKSLPTLDEKLLMVEELNALIHKRALIRTALKDVSDFYISPSGGCHMKVTDSNDKSFSISHPVVIEEVLKQVTFKLEDELDQVETRFSLLY